MLVSCSYLPPKFRCMCGDGLFRKAEAGTTSGRLKTFFRRLPVSVRKGLFQFNNAVAGAFRIICFALYKGSMWRSQSLYKNFPSLLPDKQGAKLLHLSDTFTKLLLGAVNFPSVGRQVRGLKVYSYKNNSAKTSPQLYKDAFRVSGGGGFRRFINFLFNR